MYLYKNSVSDTGMNYVKYDNYLFHSVPHVHKDLELVYVGCGRVRAVVDGTSAEAGEGECIMILPHQIHYYDANSRASSTVVNFSGELVPQFLSDLGSNTVDHNNFCPDYLADRMINQILLRDAAQTVYEQKCVLYAVCNSFLKSVKLTPREYPECAPAFRVIHYVAEHYREDVNLKDIAEKYGYEYHYLSRMFHRTTNVSFRDFLNYHRIECARSMLKNSAANVSQIAMDCGFQNIRSFNRAFQEIMGTTPQSFRTSGE